MITIDIGGPVQMGAYFETVKPNFKAQFVKDAEAIERSARIEEHPFFNEARHNRNALLLWASQEVLVTNPFSQILFRVISNIRNVHVRSLLLPVVNGEHSTLRNGTADLSHPWLIWRLCKSLGIDMKQIVPTDALIQFIDALASAADDPMRALGVLGIGNELMLLAEYRAVESCFDAVCPDAEYLEFLRANIDEDVVHTAIIGEAASALAQLGFSEQSFRIGAREGVNARMLYYDMLLEAIT